MPSLARLSKRFRAPGTNGRLNLSLTWPVSEDTLKKDHARYDWGPEILGKPKRVSIPFGEAQAGWMPESTGRRSVEVGRRHPITMRKASFKTLSMRRV